MRAFSKGFTLIEVLVALVIVAFGLGAVLQALSSAADNIGGLREKSLAQWIALNLVADARLGLQAPPLGTTEGEVTGFGNGNWYWQRQVSAMDFPPGLLQISVRVRRNTTGSTASNVTSLGATTVATAPTTPFTTMKLPVTITTSSVTASSSTTNSTNTLSSALSSLSTLSCAGASSSGTGASSGGAGANCSSTGASSSGAGASSGGAGASSGSNIAFKNTDKASADDKVWLTTVIGFRGDALAVANGEVPDWAGISGGANTPTNGTGTGAGATITNPTNPAGNSSGGPTTNPVGNPGSSSGASTPLLTTPNSPTGGQ